MRFPNRFLVRSAHKTEGLSILEIDMRRMGKRSKIRSDFFQFVELREKLFFRQFTNGKAPLGSVMCVDEVFHIYFLSLMFVHCSSGRRFIHWPKMLRVYARYRPKKISDARSGWF